MEDPKVYYDEHIGELKQQLGDERINNNNLLNQLIELKLNLDKIIYDYLFNKIDERIKSNETISEHKND